MRVSLDHVRERNRRGVQSVSNFQLKLSFVNARAVSSPRVWLRYCASAMTRITRPLPERVSGVMFATTAFPLPYAWDA